MWRLFVPPGRVRSPDAGVGDGTPLDPTHGGAVRRGHSRAPPPPTALIERTAGWRPPPETAPKRAGQGLARAQRCAASATRQPGRGRRWVVSRPSGRRRGLVIGWQRARPGATRACALPRAAADRRATRGASGSSRRPHGPRSSPAGAAARRRSGHAKMSATLAPGTPVSGAPQHRSTARQPSGQGRRRRRRKTSRMRRSDPDRQVAPTATARAACLREMFTDC